jgi:DNA-binding MarR family transcriptional regulator
LTSTDLSAGLGLDISSTTRLVDELVKKKLAVRSRGIDDGRVRKIDMTEAGKKLIARVEEDFASIIGNALSELPEAVRAALPDVILRLNRVMACVSNQTIIPEDQIRKKAI